MSVATSPSTETALAAPPERISLRRALRQAATDLYFNSWRMAPANLVWGALLILALIAGPFSLIGIALLVALAAPTAGLHRMGALVARGEPASFSDFVGGMRRFWLRAIAVTVGAAVLAVVLTTNVLVGLANANPVGWFISAMALWGVVGLAMLLVAFWPILVDPRRETAGFRAKLSLAGLVVIGRPMRVLALTVVVGVIIFASTILFAALVIMSIAYVSLVSSRYVLPLADQVEQQVAARRAA